MTSLQRIGGWLNFSQKHLEFVLFRKIFSVSRHRPCSLPDCGNPGQRSSLRNYNTPGLVHHKGYLFVNYNYTTYSAGKYQCRLQTQTKLISYSPTVVIIH